jgi:CDGSH-type Zn-finger protein
MLEDSDIKKIIIETNGPYVVQGNIPLVSKTQVVSEYGEPLTWKKEDTIPTDGTYCLCRCGLSAEKPFCDGTHDDACFDGSETADTRPTAERQQVYPGATNIIVKRDHALCSESGFCGNRVTKIKYMVANTSDPQVRAQIMAMIERCPSGSYTYSLAENAPDIEPDLPQQIAMTTDILSTGPVPGALWVTGSIPIERSDGKPFETRNRVTLCSCGRSKIKPLCDGAHREPE